jgi:3-methyl-2-oxobutanoate hydroxymethyltransferase
MIKSHQLLSLKYPSLLVAFTGSRISGQSPDLQAGEAVGLDNALPDDTLPTTNIVTIAHKITRQLFGEGETGMEQGMETGTKPIYTWDAKPSRRNLTAADIRACKGVRKLTQTTANTVEEAAAAADAGIDMLICGAANVGLVRQGAPHHFLTAALTIPDYPTDEDILRGALTALKQGADSVMTARRLAVVEMLANEDIPVMGHLGLVPRKSTWRGGLRAVGRTADEALALMQDFRDLENAGAFSVEAEVIPADVLAAISPRTGLITMSLGSGPGGDVMYLFQNDICGENPLPRHSRAFGNLAALADQMAAERRAALSAFREASLDGSFPGPAENAKIPATELDAFLAALEKKS